MKHRLLAVGVVALAAIAFAFADDKPKLGPEWTEDKQAQNFFKMMQIKVTRSAGGNARNYYLDLEHDKVRVVDTDDNIATSVSVNNSAGLEVRKDPKGAPSVVSVNVNKCTYHDMNCDGVWDAWDDARDGRKRYIRLNDRWVQVGDFIGGFSNGVREVKSLDRKTEYIWDGKAWDSRAPKPQ
jgi:hypothetical protein